MKSPRTVIHVVTRVETVLIAVLDGNAVETRPIRLELAKCDAGEFRKAAQLVERERQRFIQGLPPTPAEPPSAPAPAKDKAR